MGDFIFSMGKSWKITMSMFGIFRNIKELRGGFDHELV